jgi:hypothetical protein
VKNTISAFSSFLLPKFRSTLRVRFSLPFKKTHSLTPSRPPKQAGIDQLFNQLLRPKLRTLIADVYKDVSYVLDETSYAAAEYHDVVRKRFIKAWEGVVDGFKDTFTDRNYDLFFSLALDVLLRPWEKSMMGFKFTEVSLPSVLLPLYL